MRRRRMLQRHVIHDGDVTRSGYGRGKASITVCHWAGRNRSSAFVKVAESGDHGVELFKSTVG
jgi:hypothetical protein